MELRLKNYQASVDEHIADRLSLVKLHSTLCFLMSQYYQHQSPKLAQFIVNHIRLVIEHPDLDAHDDCRSMHLHLLQQWQNITLALAKSSSHLKKMADLKH